MSELKPTFTPPKSADRFLSFFCKEEWIEPIKGDLFEQYQLDRREHGRFRSSCHYWINTINFIRPFALKRNATTINHIAMLRNILKTFRRQLIRKPLHHLINIFGLAFGLMVVFLAMLWINYHQSFDQFHSKKDQIYKVMTNRFSNSGTQTSSGAILEVTEHAEQNIADIEHVTRIIANWRWPSEQCFKIDENKPCIYSKGMFADSSFFKVFDIEILSGPKNPLINPKSIALSESVARKLYGDINPVGMEYLVDNHFKVTISAVYRDIPPTSSLQFEFIAPLELAYSLWGQKVENMKSYSFITYMSLKSKDHASVQNQINGLPIADKYENLSVILHPLNEVHLYNNFKNGKATGGLATYVQIIGLFAIFILAMSMANFINLTTAQSSLRGKEIGVRKVNGASKASLHFQFLIETFLNVTIASVLALALAYALLPYLNLLIGEEIQFAPDTNFVLKLIAIITSTTLLSGIYPALILSRFNPVRVLKNLPFKAGGKRNIRRWLTITQISISGVIILLTSVFYLQLDYMQNLSTGYDRKGILVMEPTFNHIRKYKAFTEELKSNPLIREVGACNANMIDADFITDQVSWNGKDQSEQVQFKPIGAENGLLSVFELDILEGTYFNTSDTSNQIVLTESALAKIGLKQPVGQHIQVFGERCRIVGVIRDFNSQSLHESLIPTIIYQVKPENTGTFYIRYDNNRPVESIAFIEDVYDKFEPFFNMKSKILDEEYAKLYQQEKVISSLSIFAMIIAMIIATIGILGLSTFNTIRRFKEIGLRKIFGASGSQIIHTLSKEFIWIALIANLIAWPLSFWIMDYWLSGFAYRISVPYQIFPVNLLLTASVIFLLVAIQSLRVINLNPTEVIRNE